MLGDPLSDRSWTVAQLSIQHGGLGIRDPARHSSAAYFVSLIQTRSLFKRIDIQLEEDDASGGSHLHASEADLRANCLESATFDRGGRGIRQKELSGFLDAAMLQQLQADSTHDAFFGRTSPSPLCPVLELGSQPRQLRMAAKSIHHCSRSP
jgi:hypothetical protein